MLLFLFYFLGELFVKSFLSPFKNFMVFYMILFGLGTIPLMSIVVYINAFLTLKVRNKIQKIIPYVAVFIGVLFILRGLGLGIPYISPNTTSLFVQQNPNCH